MSIITENDIIIKFLTLTFHEVQIANITLK